MVRKNRHLEKLSTLTKLTIMFSMFDSRLKDRQAFILTIQPLRVINT